MARTKSESQSQAIINELKQQGYSYSKIAKAVGRDSSLISQGAKGKKPLANLEGALRSLLETKEVKEIPARRTRKTGEVAQVRQPKPKKEIPAFTDKKGRVLNASIDGLSKAEQRALINKIRKDGGSVSFVAKAHGYKKYRQLDAGDVDVQLFEDGLDADDFSLGSDTLEEKLIEYLIDDYDVAKVESLSDIQLNVFYEN